MAKKKPVDLSRADDDTILYINLWQRPQSLVCPLPCRAEFLLTVAPFSVAVSAHTERNKTFQPLDPTDFDGSFPGPLPRKGTYLQ